MMGNLRKNFTKKMVGAGGFEPPMPVPKTGALPLGYAPPKFISTLLSFNLARGLDQMFQRHLLTE